MKKLYTGAAPAPIGAYSQAVACDPGGRMLFVSGQLGIDPKKGSYEPLPIQEEAKWAMRNMVAILREGNMDVSDVVKYSIFLLAMKDFATVNKVCETFFTTTGYFPARETIEVSGLPLGAKVEISCIAVSER